MSAEGKYPIRVELPAPNGIKAITEDVINEHQVITIYEPETLIALQSALGEIRREDEWVSVDDDRKQI